MKEYKTTPQHAGIAQAGPLKRPLPIGTATGILNVKATGVKTSARLSCAGAVLLADTKLVPYLQQNFTKIAMVSIAIEEMPLSDIAPRQEKVKEIKTTVASLRLDAIASSGFGISRTKAAEAIKGDRVQVNWQPAKGPSQDVSQGDVISLRGKGRMELAEITGTSRKGRIGVLLKRYM